MNKLNYICFNAKFHTNFEWGDINLKIVCHQSPHSK